jgi:hypothetical protein
MSTGWSRLFATWHVAMPKGSIEANLEAFLTQPARQGVSARPPNQPFNSLPFLYRARLPQNASRKPPLAPFQPSAFSL